MFRLRIELGAADLHASHSDGTDSDQLIFSTSTSHGKAPVDGGTENNAPIVVSVIAQKFDPAGGVSFRTHDHEIVPNYSAFGKRNHPSNSGNNTLIKNRLLIREAKCFDLIR
jgi:hypothetical protein